MYLSRRALVLGGRIPMRADDPNKLKKIVTPALERDAAGIVQDNNRKLLQYKSLLHSRMLWESSSLPDNQFAFVPRRAMREVKEPPRTTPGRHLREFDNLADRARERAMKPFAKATHNDADSPIPDDDEVDKIWYSPDDLAPKDEDAAGDNEDEVMVDDDELDAQIENFEKWEPEETGGQVRAIQHMRTRERRKKILQRLEARKQMDEKSEKALPNKDEDPEGYAFAKAQMDAERALDLMEIKTLERPEEDRTVFMDPNQEDLREQLSKLDKRSHAYWTTLELLESFEFNDPAVQEKDEEIEEEDEAQMGEPRCLCCGINAPKLHPMNTYLISRFLSPHGDILPRKITGNCMRHQRDISHVYKQSKQLGLLTFKKGFYIHNPYEPAPEWMNLTSEVVDVSGASPTQDVSKLVDEEGKYPEDEIEEDEDNEDRPRGPNKKNKYAPLRSAPPQQGRNAPQQARGAPQRPQAGGRGEKEFPGERKQPWEQNKAAAPRR